MDQNQVLNQVISEIKNFKSESRILTLFDIDSTLFCVGPRTQGILRSFAQETWAQKKFPEECRALKNIEVRSTDWGIKIALERLQLKATIDFFDVLRKYWVEHFFSNNFLHLDDVYPGAVDFLNHLEELGSRVMYLTGRDVIRMGDGTKKQLLSHKFPSGDIDNQLILKPNSSFRDDFYKSKAIKSLEDQFDLIWFFENEPLIINSVRESSPNIKVIFMDTVHSGKAKVPEDLPTISFSYHFNR